MDWVGWVIGCRGQVGTTGAVELLPGHSRDAPCWHNPPVGG